MASILSGDQQLRRAFEQSDPYSHMQDILVKRSDGDGEITRDECKLHLLKSINSIFGRHIKFIYILRHFK